MIPTSPRYATLPTLTSLVVLFAGAAGAAEYVKRDTWHETIAATRQARGDDRGGERTVGPWYVAGPMKAGSFADKLFPESGVDLAAKGSDGKPRWVKRPEYVDGRVHNIPAGPSVLTYFYRVIKSPRDEPVPLGLGSDDCVTVWLNGKQILSRNVHRAAAPDQERLTLRLKRGENRFLMKIYNGNGPHGFYFSLGDQAANDAWSRFVVDFPVHADWIVRNCDGAHGYCMTDTSGRFGRAALAGAKKELDKLLASVRHLSVAYPSGYPRGEEFASRRKEIALKIAEGRAPLTVVDEYLRFRREALFANPLLTFSEILFIKKHFLPPSEGQGNHMCDQYFGFHALRGGGVFVLSDVFGDAPRARDVLGGSVCGKGRFEGKSLENGAFLSPDLSYDAKRILFAWTEGEPTRYKWTERSTYHVFGVNVDGSDLRQLTDGPVNDFDPCWMPGGRVVFISERRGGYGRCHGRPVPTYTLHSMAGDGSDIRCLSYHETNEWHPSIDNEGMIVYTRWDYVDRGFNQAHHPWTTTPDGRDARALRGNFARSQHDRPHMEMDVRAIPGSRKYVATAAGHHSQAYGSFVVFDPSIEDDEKMAQMTRLTPDVRFPEAEISNREGQRFATAWPLSEHYYLCVHDPEGKTNRGPKNRFGIYLIDSFGNRDLIYRDPDISCLSPIPLEPRHRPPVIPDMTLVGERAKGDLPASGTVGIMDVYDSLLPLPEGVKITALRVVQVLPKTTPHANGPRIGYGDQKNARAVLGTVPVEADGSAHFELPAGKPVYFQALDAKGLAVQSMRSDTYVHPGERLMCQGCHQPRHRSPRLSERFPVAMQRAPSKIAPDVDGSMPFSFPRLVQPVLDKKCVTCHKSKSRAPDLSKGNWERDGHKWYASYRNLQKHAFFFNNPVFTVPRTTPGKFGARASRLYRMLTGGHHKVELTEEELHRIALWLDCNSDFFGAYEMTVEQARGEVVKPSLE